MQSRIRSRCCETEDAAVNLEKNRKTWHSIVSYQYANEVVQPSQGHDVLTLKMTLKMPIAMKRIGARLYRPSFPTKEPPSAVPFPGGSGPTRISATYRPKLENLHQFPRIFRWLKMDLMSTPSSGQNWKLSIYFLATRLSWLHFRRLKCISAAWRQNQIVSMRRNWLFPRKIDYFPLIEMDQRRLAAKENWLFFFRFFYFFPAPKKN